MDDYPVTFDVEYPDRPLNRLTTFFRVFMVIPIAIVIGALGAGILFPAVLLMILFRKKYPRWWFDWNVNYQSFASRVGIYMLFMDDRYPSTDEAQSVRLTYTYPDVERDLGRGMPLVKWFLAIPHYLVLIFLHIGSLFAAIFAWFAILFTGRYPRACFDYIEGVLRWHNRVLGYAFALVTDRYPPFSLD